MQIPCQQCHKTWCGLRVRIATLKLGFQPKTGNFDHPGVAFKKYCHGDEQ